jgi:dienelactone hydrolase
MMCRTYRSSIGRRPCRPVHLNGAPPPVRPVRPIHSAGRIGSALLALCLLAAALPVAAQVAPGGKQPLDHSVYDEWLRISTQSLSPDGRWVLYVLAPQDGGDTRLVVRSLSSSTEYTIACGSTARFSDDSRHVLFLVDPSEAEQEQAKQEKKKPEEQPKKALGILRLADGDLQRIERIRSYRLPAESGAWLAYLKEPALPAAAAGAAGNAPGPQAEAPAGRKASELGTDLVLRDLAGGGERVLSYTTDYRISDDGALLLYAVAEPDTAQDGVRVTETRSGRTTGLLTGPGHYRGLTFDEAGTQAAFLSDTAHRAEQPASFALYAWRRGEPAAVLRVDASTPGVPAGWWVSENRSPSFSKNGSRLFFGTAPRPEPEPAEGEGLSEEEQQVKLDIWHWRDPQLQPQQLRQADQERRRSYQAVCLLPRGRVVQLATPAMPSVDIPRDGDGPLALAVTDVPYAIRDSWDTPSWNDVHLIEVEGGRVRTLFTETQNRPSFSPGGGFLYWWDADERGWFAQSVSGGTTVALTADLPHPVWNELHDTPSPVGSYGSGGWTDEDAHFLVYDAHDLWVTDPSGKEPARCLTEGVGRRQGLRFRLVDLDRERDTFDERAPLLLSAFDVRTKADGFYQDRVRGAGEPNRLIMQDVAFSAPVKAEEAEVLLYTRQSFTEFPDLWTSDLNFRDPRRISRANPQQDEYLWGTAELVHWESVDGEPLDGILYKPEDFDPARKYPMIVTFYERNSDNLHTHWMPEPHRSIINYTFYTSRGYLVFLPDIPYRIGYPGESALNAIVPGVLKLIDTGFVDRERIGAGGHSWGGYQTAYLVTRTNLFRAAEAGAPVSNMTSAYGGIRWESGMSRMFQYEHTQSRIGATLWEAPLKYIENSPLFWADKIETPLLILHNDEDGAVPWEQGIELFVALRRLGKPAWMIVYNNQPHWPITWPNKKDWAVRLQQYWDHFLKDAPAPVWLAEGLPAVEKGKTLGKELVPPPSRQR